MLERVAYKLSLTTKRPDARMHRRHLHCIEWVVILQQRDIAALLGRLSCRCGTVAAREGLTQAAVQGPVSMVHALVRSGWFTWKPRTVVGRSPRSGRRPSVQATTVEGGL